MPVRTASKATEDITILDEDGTPILDRDGAPCRVTIRLALSQDGLTAYEASVCRFSVIPGGGFQSRDYDYRGAEDALFDHGVVAWSGFEDDGGMALPLNRWRELPPEICRQFIEPLQERATNALSGRRERPNTKRPSSESLKAEQEAQTTQQTENSSSE